MTAFRFAALLAALSSAAWAADGPWKPADNPLMTRWATEVSPERCHAEYPRPQLARSEWTNLNGLWDYKISDREADRPTDWDGKILVPFPVESALSGVKRAVGPDRRLWYRRAFRAPDSARRPGKRLLLHFGAVDWRARVYVNGKLVGEHQGGYDPFTFDITERLKKDGPQELVVSVWDPADQSWQPRGKQVLEPHGIWYTSVTGIWQTVWLEPVSEARVESVKVTPDVDDETATVELAVKAPAGSTEVRVEVLDGDERAALGTFATERPAGAVETARAVLRLRLPRPKLWSPDSPFLYDLRITMTHNGQVVDRAASYFGMRKIEVAKDERGLNRLFLNNRPLFQFGTLDQGWWPDGLYTAPTDEALKSDIEVLKKLGFNMMRKHVKVEPDRFYYHCDRLGLLVWQDMPSGDRFVKRDQPDLERSPESAANYRREYQAMIDSHYNHPCIVAWVPFNEGWGQFDTNGIIAWTKKHDPTRLVDGPSGWADRGAGDMHDMHRYPGPAMLPPEPDRAVVLGEFGGLGLPLPGHLWWDKRNWGYRTYKTLDELQANYERVIRDLRPLIGAGLAAAVYTQTTDVEGEVNGLLTYDREVLKRDVARTAALHATLYGPRPAAVKKETAPSDRAENSRPNIVFILIDDMGWTDLSCYGNKFDETPQIDGLARQGVRFTDFYSAGPVCSPTRASIQSGQYQARIGLTAHIPGHWRPFEKLIEPENAHYLPLETVTIGEALKAAGYQTGYFGKWHLNWNGGSGEGSDFLPDKQGYDVWSAGGPRRRPGAAAGELDPKRIDRLTDLTCKFIEDHKEGPFFVTLSHYAVHIPIEAKPDEIRKYVKKPKPPEGVNNPVYAAMVAHTDESVGRILRKLDELQLADNTLVLFSSDNGGLFRRYDGYGIAISSNEPLRGEKGSLYEGGIRVPTIVRWPGTARPGGVCREPAISIDFYPTLLEAAGVAPPEDVTLDGQSLVPLLKDPNASLPRDAIFFHYPHYHHSRPSGAIRRRNWKLIEFFDTGEVELYDLEKDLGEHVNLAEARPEEARELKGRLAAWRASVGARMPRKNPRYDPARAGQWWSRRTGQPLDEEVLKRNYEAEKAMMKKWTGQDWN